MNPEAKKEKLFFLITLLTVGSFPPLLTAQIPVQETNRIIIEEGGIYAVSRSVSDKIPVNTRTKSVLCVRPDSVRSVWYKIYVLADSKITFEIFPSDPASRYNYFLYQHQGDLGVEEVHATNIAPVRANLYNGRMKVGTGLSLSSNVSVTDSCPRNLVDIFYHTPYHAPLTVKAGHVLLLNVYHLRGTDCGHHFILNTTGSSQEFHSIYESCYREEDIMKQEGRTFVPGPLFVHRPAGKAKGLFSVKDSLLQGSLEVQVTSQQERNTVSTTARSEIKDVYEITLEKNTSYQITFSSFGYQNKAYSFSTTDTLIGFRKDILLSLIKAGESFVMDKIYFNPNTYAMKTGSLPQIAQLARHLNAHPEIKIEIQGHTNGNKRIKRSYAPKENGKVITEGRFRGSAKKLSQYRAALIKKHLEEKGVAPQRLISQGCGGSKMIHPLPKDQKEADKNIRVSVLILRPQENGVPVSAATK